MKNLIAIIASLFVLTALIFSPSPVHAAGVVSPPCIQAALQSALSGGGTATITLTSALTINQNTTINGGSLALGGAFSGGNGRVTILNSLFSGNVVDRPGTRMATAAVSAAPTAS